MALSSRLIALLVPLAIFGLPSCARAHVIPNDAKIAALVKPQGQHLQLIVRVPLEAMVDLNYPTKDVNGNLVDLDHVDRVLKELASLWVGDNLAMYENGRLLPSPQVMEVRASLPFDGSFASFDQALQHVTGPRLTNSVDLVWNQGMLDILFDVPITSDRSQFAIHSKLSALALRTSTTLRLLRANGDSRSFEFLGDPGLIVLDPTWYQTATGFVRTGFFEILGSADYWLFLFVLAFPLRRAGMLVPVAVSFALAEAITLNPSTSFTPEAFWFQPLIALVLAAATLYLAIENGMRVGAGHRWMLAFVFGLALGFRFAMAVHDTLQFSGTHAMVSLLSFGAGADAAQFLLLLLFLPVTSLLRRLATDQVVTFVAALMSGDIAWHWLGTRYSILSQYPIQWHSITPALALQIVRWTTDLVVAAAAFWLLFTAFRRFVPDHQRPPDEAISGVKQ